MRAGVVIPWRGGCSHRERALAEVLKRHTLPVTLAECPPGPWIKALAVMPAIERSEAEVIVVADADVWTDGIPEAVQTVEAGASFAIPHLNVHRLTEDGTHAVLAGEPWQDQPLEQRQYRGIPGGGFVVARRETLLAVPLDPRFVGWGQEDSSWAVALGTLLGPPWRGTADLVHLWHPAQPRHSRTRGSKAGWALRKRYLLARRDPDAMYQLVQEARELLRGREDPTEAGPLVQRA